MNIVITRRMTGAQYKAWLIEGHGSLEEIALKAKGKGVEANLAKSILADLKQFEEEPGRLKQLMTIRDSLDREALRHLTGFKMDIIELIEEMGRARVTDIAERAGKDKKNVSEAVSDLERLGVLRSKREGREKYVEPVKGAKIEITLA